MEGAQRAGMTGRKEKSGSEKRSTGKTSRVGTEGEWRQVFGGYDRCGFSVEWHDFMATEPMNWWNVFHPGSLEICVNLSGTGYLSRGDEAKVLPSSVCYYHDAPRSSIRCSGHRHRFLTIGMSRSWLIPRLDSVADQWPEGVRSFMEGRRFRWSREHSRPLSAGVRRAAEEMLCPPGALAGLWYPAKIMEIASQLFAPAEVAGDRQKRAWSERVEAVKRILARDLEYPPGLSEISREVGCSQFHLSRIFSEVTGTTITRYLRRLRLDRAAELLCTGKFNVTETSMMVGYSSLSHFSRAFAEQFGHCPCVFPLQQSAHLPERLSK